MNEAGQRQYGQNISYVEEHVAPEGKVETKENLFWFSPFLIKKKYLNICNPVDEKESLQ